LEAVLRVCELIPKRADACLGSAVQVNC